jgi:hypothetical protein
MIPGFQMPRQLIRDGLVSRWVLSSGSSVDRHGSNNCTEYGSPALPVFDGVNDYLTTAASANGLTACTVLMQFSPFESNSCVAVCQRTAINGFYLGTYAGQLYAVVANFVLGVWSDVHRRTGISGTQKRWAALSFDASLPLTQRLNLHLDGVIPSTTDNNLNYMPDSLSCAGLMTIGRDVQVNEFSKGSIYEVRLYNKALSTMTHAAIVNGQG